MKKSFFDFGFSIFGEWHRKWNSFKTFWPNSSGPETTPLDEVFCSSFYWNQAKIRVFWDFGWRTGFWVQKLWPK